MTTTYRSIGHYVRDSIFKLVCGIPLELELANPFDMEGEFDWVNLSEHLNAMKISGAPIDDTEPTNLREFLERFVPLDDDSALMRRLMAISLFLAVLDEDTPYLGAIKAALGWARDEPATDAEREAVATITERVEKALRSNLVALIADEKAVDHILERFDEEYDLDGYVSDVCEALCLPVPETFTPVHDVAFFRHITGFDGVEPARIRWLDDDSRGAFFRAELLKRG